MSVLLDDAGSDQWLNNASWTAVIAPPFTMTAWARVDADITGAIIALGDVSVDNHFFILRRGAIGDILQGFLQGGGGAVSWNRSGFTANVWHHVAWVEIANNNRNIFLDGVAATANTTPVAPTGIDNLAIGASPISTTDSFWSGNIVWPCVYNIALSVDELQMHVNRVHPYRIRRDALVSFPPLRGDAYHDNIDDIDLSVNGTPVLSADPPGLDHLRFRHRRMLGSKILR